MFSYQSGLLLCTSILGGLKVITNKVHQPQQNMRHCGSMETMHLTKISASAPLKNKRVSERTMVLLPIQIN